MPKTLKGDSDAVTVRLPRSVLQRLDQWRRKRAETRARAIKTIVEQALATDSMRRPSRKSATTAANMAEKEIDRQADRSTNEAEQGRRKRQLLEGPKEFRRPRRSR